MSLTVIGTLGNLPAAQLDTRIIALCDRAATRLQQATTLGELETIRAEMQALRVYAEKMKAIEAAIAQCWELSMLAEARIGAELKAAQERGEVATRAHHPGSVPSGNTAPATAGEIGLTRKQAMNAKALAGREPAIRAEAKAALAEGRRPSRKNILNAIPIIKERPPECTHFVLWLRTGALLVSKLGDPASFLDLMASHRLPVPPEEVEAVMAFLSAVEGARR